MFIQPKRQQTAKPTSIPAPVKGLNAKDAIANMDPTFALVMDNWFCSPSTVDTRNGSINWVTGITGNVETIAPYVGPVTPKLFAAASTSIYDVTSSGTVGAAVVTGLSSARFQTINFSTPGGHFLYMVDGKSNPQLYDGTTWHSITAISSPYAITGVTTTNLVHVNSFQNRLYFVENASMHVWYLPIQSIAGAATLFDLSSIFTLGGYLVAMMTWTIDNTSGVQDYAVFITSEGEVAIYQGYDPSFAATFTLVGVFRMGRPVGRRCFVKMGSDNVVINSDGVVTLSKELTTDRDISSALSYNIQKIINDDVQLYNDNFGWQPVYHPLGTKLIINVPSEEDSNSYQYVMNTITGAWSTWGKENSALNAFCWAILDDVLYYGGAGAVIQADVPGQYSDNTNAIQADLKPAFSYFGDLGASKYFTMVRPIFLSTDPIVPSYVLCIDYDDVVPATPPLAVGTGSPWDTSPWDISSWGSYGYQVNKNWLTVGGIGYAASLRMSILTKGVQASLQSIDYVYETGGVL